LAEGWTAGPPQAADPAAFSRAGPSEQRAAKQPDPSEARGSPKKIAAVLWEKLLLNKIS